MGKSYLVDGAKLRCVHGSKSGCLRVSAGCNNYAENGKQKACSADCKPKDNIPFFGSCKLKGGKPCEKYMKLKKKWENPGIIALAEQINGNTALTMNSFLVCNIGGLIFPEVSGQGKTQSINWREYWNRYLSMLNFLDIRSMGSRWLFDPVNVNTGNFVYEREDLVIRGITKLSFHMTYYSMGENQGGSIGEGWHHNYEIYVEEKEFGGLWLHLGDGQIAPCMRSMGTIYALMGVTGLLKREDDGYRYASGTGLEYRFDKDGRITERKDGDGNTDIFLHNKSGQLIEVRGANGGVLHYDYNKEGNLYRVSDHTGREVRLCYRYRVLCQFINSSGQKYTYHYNENLRLESVTTPRGIVGVKNVYDNANRVVEQITPDGGVVEFRYDDKGMCTHAKNQDGFITSYESDEKFRNIRTIYQDSEETFAYNENNQCISYVDRNGNQTRYSYDEQGRLRGIVNALGERRDFSYNKDGKLLSLCIDDKTLLENTYDQNGYLVKTTDALGRSRETVYAKRGLPERMIMPDGSEIKIAYDERGNVQSVTDAYGVVTEYSYDALNRLIQITDGEGNRVSYQYDERDHLLSETNPEGDVRKYVYDVSGRPVQIEDFDGGIVAFSYNAMGKPEILTDKEGRETKRTYDLSGRIEKEVSPTGRTTIYQYDRDGRLVQIRRVASEQEEESKNVTDLVYDPVGNLLRVKTGDGQEIMSETSYEYDALNRVVTTIDPVGGRTTYTYDKRSGKISSVTDAAENRRTFRYNDAGELIEETDIRGNVIRYQYNELGRITAITDAAGRVTRYYYLPGGRLEKSVYSDGRKMFYEYDALGRIRQKTDGKGYRLSYTYDSMGRILRVVSSAGQETSYVYDAAGNVTAITDAGGNMTRYAYTLSGKLKEVTDALGNRTEYTYDAEDRLIHICQHGAEGEEDRTTEYERDAFGRVTCVRSASGEEYCHYDALGRMIEKTDREGLATAYTYMADGMPESILYSDGRKAEFSYTPLRQLAMVKDWLGETKIDRDRQGMPVEITDHKGRSIHYEWGDLGERRRLIYPDGTTLKWQYDEMLRPVELIRTAGGEEPLRINYRYDEQGRLSEKRNSGGYHTCWYYNELGQLDELLHKDQSGVLDKFCYAYDAMGNKTTVSKERRGFPTESGEYRYVYDALQRLTGVEKDGRKLRSYQYDSFGNRTCMEDYAEDMRYVFTYDSMNQMLEKTIVPISEAGKTALHTTYVYDGRGNLTGEYCDGHLLHGYAYNTANRLERSWDEEGREAAYFYNALGQRTGRHSGEETEEYLLDLTKPYHNLLGVEKEDGMQKFFWDSNAAVMEDEQKKLHYYMQDELGSPLRVLYGNGNGDVYGYDEFGRETSFAGRYSRQGERQPFGYTGYRYDAIGHTYFAQAREYQPEYGRFLAEDIKKGRGTAPKTRNRYGYCWNNPVGMVDLDGKEPEVPASGLQFPQLTPREEVDVDAAISRLMEPFEPPKENKSTGNFVDVKELVSSLEATPPKQEDYGGGITAGIREATKDWNGVFIGSLTYSIGSGGYLSGGFQVVDDWHGNHAIYIMDGTGVQAGESAKVNIGFGYLDVPTIEQAKGLGTETGLSVGEFITIGASGITANEDNGAYVGDGGMFNVGFGGNPTFVEGHTSMAYARRWLGWNYYDVIDNFGFFLKEIFNGSTNVELCKN